MGLGGIKVSESVIYVMFYYFIVDMSIKKRFTNFIKIHSQLGLLCPVQKWHERRKGIMTWKRIDMKI